MNTFDEVRNSTRIPLPKDGYLFRYGASMYAVSYLEHGLKFRCFELAELFDLEFTLYDKKKLQEGFRVVKSTGTLFADFGRLLKESGDKDLLRMRKGILATLESVVSLRNALAHGSPGTDPEDGYSQKLFRTSEQDSYMVTDQKMDELLQYATKASLVISDLGEQLKWKKYQSLTGENGPLRKFTDAEVEEMLRMEEIINASGD